ncbi:MAG: ABC transporter permease [Nitrospirae bacterium GWD2_57_9]|nr:MAG: ABC transporter permease [Nitrospirae bacterium GWD2_57_9]
MKRFLAILHARNMEFLRDRSTLAWSVVFPVLLVLGFAFMFSGGPKAMFKVGVFGDPGSLPAEAASFFETRYIRFIPVPDVRKAIDKVEHFQLDMLVDVHNGRRYWINSNSPNGYILERLLAADRDPGYERLIVTGREIRYVDWVVPGILAMNMMFSCLFGVGYVIVRYRKNGFLKRLKATPLTPFEFLLAQMVSRLLLIQVVTAGVYAGCNAFIHFQMRGSYLDLFLISLAGAVCLISLGLLVAARFTSEELAGGILNVLTWPMMLLSGVWFSLEGANPVVRKIAQFLPLTHLVDGARAIMTEGAGLMDVAPHIVVLAAMTAIFLTVGSFIFRWE